MKKNQNLKHIGYIIFAKNNIPNKNLYCGELVKSKFNEAQAFKRKREEIQTSIQKIILVSDYYHLSRGIWSFEYVLGKLLLALLQVHSSWLILSSGDIKNLEEKSFERLKKGFHLICYGLLKQDKLITHGDVNRIIKGKTSKGVEDTCNVVLPELTSSNYEIIKRRTNGINRFS